MRSALLCRVLLPWLLACSVLTTGCGAGARPPTHLAGSQAYLPGLAADLYLPSSSGALGAVPVVVLVPGGGWRTAHREGLTPLAESLAAAGFAAVNITYQGTADGGHFPLMVAQVLCGVDFAVQRVRQAGVAPGPVVVLGHSAGGHLAALAALAGPHFRADQVAGCPYPQATIDGLVGLAGTYDVFQLGEYARPLFGVDRTANPQLWREGDPATWAGARASAHDLSVLLEHGTDDDLVPPSTTTAFATRLREAGQAAQVEMVAGADHERLSQAAVIAQPVIRWVRLLPGGR